MFKKIFILLKIGRKLAKSGTIEIVSEVYRPPILFKIFFFIFAKCTCAIEEAATGSLNS